jgi:hypothetical protein
MAGRGHPVLTWGVASRWTETRQGAALDARRLGRPAPPWCVWPGYIGSARPVAPGGEPSTPPLADLTSPISRSCSCSHALAVQPGVAGRELVSSTEC